MNKAEMHKKLCDKLHEIYVAKNSDYGDSFKVVRDKYKNSILIRLNDKLNRLEALYSNNQLRQVKDESVKDTLLDLANYCLMELIELEVEENGRVIYGEGANKTKAVENR